MLIEKNKMDTRFSSPRSRCPNLTYQKPSKEILDLADFSTPPAVIMDSKREVCVLIYRPAYKSLKALSRKDMKIGGLRIDPKTNISSTVSYANNLKIKNAHDTDEKQVVGLPKKAQLAHFSFSPNEAYLGLTQTTEKGVELWVVELATAQATRITTDYLNANLGRPFIWLGDSKSFLALVLPQNRPSLKDSENELPKGPTVAMGTGKPPRFARIRI